MPTPMATNAANVNATLTGSTPTASRSARCGAASTINPVSTAPPTM